MGISNRLPKVFLKPFVDNLPAQDMAGFSIQKLPEWFAYLRHGGGESGLTIALSVVSPLSRAAWRVFGELGEGVGGGEARTHRLSPLVVDGKRNVARSTSLRR